eukprot:scaffold2975_cov135-Skeletonema_menzelii.AAC.3
MRYFKPTSPYPLDSHSPIAGWIEDSAVYLSLFFQTHEIRDCDVLDVDAVIRVNPKKIQMPSLSRKRPSAAGAFVLILTSPPFIINQKVA